MIDATLLKTGLEGLIGWRQNEDPSDTQLTELTTSASGLWYNDIHPLLSFAAIKSIYEERSIVYPTYAAGTTYSAGKKVLSASVNYYSLTDGNIGNTPASSPTNWKPFNSFTLWLKEKTEAALIQTVNDWLNLKFENRSGANLLEDDQLFRTTGNWQVETSSPTKRWVGYEIKSIRSLGVNFRIRELTVHSLDEAVPVYLYRTDSNEIVEQVTNTGVDSVPVWSVIEWNLDPSGSYLLIYDSDAVVGTIYNDVKDFNQFEDGSINYPAARYADIHAIQFDGAPGVPDLSTIEYISDNNFGMNIRFDVFCDYTSFVIAQRHLFQMAFLRKVGITFLKLFAYNPEAQSNRYISRFALNDLLFEIYGDTQTTKPNDKVGLFQEYTADLKKIRFDKKSIASECLPCRDSIINFTSVF